MIQQSVVTSPVGLLLLTASAHGLRSVQWHSDTTPARCPDGAAATVLHTAAAQLAEYFAGERHTFELALDAVGTPFQHDAWQVLRNIPYGTTISYAEQASRLGDRLKSRAVGMANAKNPLCIVVPCHRVVASNGTLGGFSGGLAAKQWLLEHERSLTPRR